MLSRDYSQLLGGRLAGLSDRMLREHLALYARYVDTLNAIEAEYPKLDWTRPGEGQDPAPPGAAGLLDARIASFNLRPEGVLADVLSAVKQEAEAAGISIWPNVYLGDGAFWTTDRALSVNVPWFLANPVLWWLVNDRKARYTREEVARAMRHELGHVVGYAFKLYARPDWTALFGDFTKPYGDNYTADPSSRAFVRYLHRTGDKHYAQKHPDEDWAETFASWLDPGEHALDKYQPGTGARAKLDFVEALSREGAFSGRATVTDRGHPNPYKSLPGTVRDYLGDAGPNGGWSPHSELLRREPYVYDAVVLHETYFESLGGERRNVGPPSNLVRFAVEAFGSLDSWLLDLRAIAGATTGWAVTCWDERAGRLRNALVEEHHRGLLAGCPVLLAVDCWEHAYAADYGIAKHLYLGAFFRNVNWTVVEERLERACAPRLRGAELLEDERVPDDAGGETRDLADRKMAGVSPTGPYAARIDPKSPTGRQVGDILREALAVIIAPGATDEAVNAALAKVRATRDDYAIVAAEAAARLSR